MTNIQYVGIVAAVSVAFKQLLRGYNIVICCKGSVCLAVFRSLKNKQTYVANLAS